MRENGCYPGESCISSSLTIEKGELEFTKKDEIGRGTEYTHSLESKENCPRKIMVGWTYDKKDILIMTVYEVKRKSRQI